MNRAVAFGLVGGAVSFVVGLVFVVAGERFAAPAGPAALSGMVAGATGMLFALFLRAGVKPIVMTLGLVVAAVWHGISLSLYGLAGGILLLAAALSAFITLDEERGAGGSPSA